ncbi:sigma factor-like helix-turn-helix DNA-binding protein [Streptomyces sp. NPDC102451]|uniref:sigma factor-like helix-turn-helix DNA-binding protein n=1 Tax=Streptomyces sp. NPDC102451 TaxID=3366177 RepID=UPI00382169B0
MIRHAEDPEAMDPGTAFTDDRWALIWSHRDELLDVARGCSQSAEDAEDAVHEAMICARETPDIPYGRVRPWLRLATLRACADRRRQVARDAELSAACPVAPADPSPVEEAACDRAEARWIAARSAELLPARQAEALRLHSQGHDVGQVARTMGLSYRATESLLARARRSLRAALAGSLTLAAAVWLSVRRLPRTGFAQQAVAASAAATVAAAGLTLSAPVRPESPRPADRPGGSAPRAVESPAPHVHPARSPAPSTARGPQDSADRTGRDTSHPVTRNPPRTYEPPRAAPVEISIELGTGEAVPTPVPRSVPTSVPSLPPVDASGADATEALLDLSRFDRFPS